MELEPNLMIVWKQRQLMLFLVIIKFLFQQQKQKLVILWVLQRHLILQFAIQP